MTAVVNLPAKLDTSAAALLRAEVAASAGNDLTIEANAVEHLGALCLEVLLTARHVWSSGGQKLELAAPSQAFLADLETFGLAPDDLSTGVAL